MKSNTLKPFLLLLGVALLCLGTLAMVGAGKGQEPSGRDDAELVEALRRGGLIEAARLKRHYVGRANTSQWLKFDLETLTKNSAGVVVGTPVGHGSQLTPSGNLITTTYKIKVQQALKGSVPPSDMIDVVLPGGKVVFEDGTSAELLTPDLKQMESGKTYILFLSTRKDVGGGFILTGGGQGLFELPKDKTGVKPHGHHSDSVQKHKNEAVEEFLEKVKAAVAKYPEASACCGN
jgi:hypothetical protein